MRTRYFIALLACATMLAPLGTARNKKPKEDPKDQIEVVGHVPLASSAVKRFIATQHYSSYYLYAEHADGKLTLIDVTKESDPVVLADVVSAQNVASRSLSAVAGTAALVSSEPVPASADEPPQTITIMDLSDPKAPKVAREFNGVTAISKDGGRGLIFLANADGLWILRRHFAEDPEVQRAYEDYVIYGSSMYPPHK
ncbi:MAG: hypothetical protein WAL45_20655 [Terracidiphilus sp.]